MFICTKEGVYRHEILGLFTTIEKAIGRGILFVIDEESDGYHSVSISELNIDESIYSDAKLVASVRRVGYRAIHGTNGPCIISNGEITIERL